MWEGPVPLFFRKPYLKRTTKTILSQDIPQESPTRLHLKVSSPLNTATKALIKPQTFVETISKLSLAIVNFGPNFQYEHDKNSFQVS